MAEAASTDYQVMTTADGTPLKVSLQRALRRSKTKSVLLVAPLFLFILFSFLLPIFDMLFRSVENQIVAESLPRSVAALKDWDPETGLPSEDTFKAMVEDIQEGAETRSTGRVGTRLNYEMSGMSSLFRKSTRKAEDITAPPYKEQLIDIDEDWGDIEVWQLIQRESDAFTISYYLAAIDMALTPDGEIVSQPAYAQVYVNLFIRTLWLSLTITGLCLLLGYPISYLLATLPTRSSNLLMIMVLLPFWTSLLVRTTAWIALLQQEGVINDILVWTGVISDSGRLSMIHNQTGTIIAMTHILLPFMVLPLYSVMKTIPKSYMRAALSLGANPVLAFIRIYMPNTVAGVGAGSILVFIISIGYYITPALVGGTSGTLISNFIAYHMSNSLNWGLAAALGTILLAVVLALYLLYDKIVGIDNMKLG